MDFLHCLEIPARSGMSPGAGVPISNRPYLAGIEETLQ